MKYVKLGNSDLNVSRICILAVGVISVIIALIQPLQASQFILAGVLRGAGDTRATAVITFITVLLVRPGIALLMINVFDTGLYGASQIISYEDYIPAEVQRLEQAVVRQAGRYVIVAVTGDPDAVEKIIDNHLK